MTLKPALANSIAEGKADVPQADDANHGRSILDPGQDFLLERLPSHSTSPGERCEGAR